MGSAAVLYLIGSVVHCRRRERHFRAEARRIAKAAADMAEMYAPVIDDGEQRASINPKMPRRRELSGFFGPAGELSVGRTAEEPSERSERPEGQKDARPPKVRSGRVSIGGFTLFGPTSLPSVSRLAARATCASPSSPRARPIGRRRRLPTPTTRRR